MRRRRVAVGCLASLTVSLVGFLTMGMSAASCAASEIGDRDGVGDSSLSSDSLIDAGASCELDGDACADAAALDGDDYEWRPVKTEHPAGRGLSSVWGSGRNDVWAVGAAGSVIHWNGEKWTSVPVDTTWSLYAVWGSGPHDVWAVSGANKIYRTTGFMGDAAHWTPVIPNWDDKGAVQGVPLSVRVISAIWGTSPTDVWIAGDNVQVRRGAIRTSESAWRSVVVDGGAAWAPAIQGSFASTTPRIKAIWGSGPEDVWVVGSIGTEALDRGRSFAAHTNGVTAAEGGVPLWTEFDTQTLSTLYAVWGSGRGDVWAVGDHGAIRHFIAGGDAWSIVDSPTTEHLRGLWGSGPNDIWAVGEHGTFLHYDGVAWRTSSGAFPHGEKPHLYGVWGSGPSDVWAVGNEIVMHFSGPPSEAQGSGR